MKTSNKYWNSANFRERWVHGERKARGLRVLPKGKGYFVHVTSRTRGQEFLFGDLEKKSFLLRMRQWSVFSGIGVLTHCLMSNHFHLLLWVPPVSSLSHDEILSRLKVVWPEEKVEGWESIYSSQNPTGKEEMDRKMMDRMGDLPSFMRVLKQSFSNWYNHREGCKGTLWEGRYRSVVVEDNPLALLSVSAYIDLNPLRAGIVTDPMDYLWSGYGSACGGDEPSRKGLHFLIKCSRGELPNPALIARKNYLRQNAEKGMHSEIMFSGKLKRLEPAGWEDTQKAYRIWLYAKGAQPSPGNTLLRSHSKRGIPPEEAWAEFEKNGEVPFARVFLHKWRCFSRGVGIGSPIFLQDLFEEYRSCFGPHRTEGGRTLKIALPGLSIMRQVD